MNSNDLRDEIYELIDNFRIDCGVALNQDVDVDMQEATDQILSLLEGMVKTNNITWTKLGDRTFISRDELLEKLK